MNVRGTLPTTNLSLGDGNDRVYVSSKADVGELGKPQFLAGDLDRIAGTLNIDAGSGRQTLLVSDEGSTVGDTGVLVTDDRGAAAGRDSHVTDGESVFGAPQEIYLVGLAQGSITYRADADGSFADGIRIWAGSATTPSSSTAPTAAPACAPRRGSTPVSATTTCQVDLRNGQDGFFVLDTQGPNDHLLHLGVSLSDGDEPVSGDTTTVTVNGVVDPAGPLRGQHPGAHGRPVRLVPPGTPPPSAPST